MSNLRNGKAQSSLLILVGLAALVFVLWGTLNFLNITDEKRILEQLSLTKITKYLDIAKGFSRDATLIAAHVATQFIAQHGGDDDRQPSGLARFWICNGDVSPTVNEVRFFLGEETKFRLNQYVSNYKVDDLPALVVRNYTCVNYNVNDKSVFFGLNDERFDIQALGSTINVTLLPDKVGSSNDVDIDVAQVRFWYMYRIFKDWAAKTPFPQRICACVSSTICGCPNGYSIDTCPSFYGCAKNAVDITAKELEDTFNDPFIDCFGSLGCSYNEVGSNTGECSRCENWQNAPACNICEAKRAGQLCAKRIAQTAEEISTGTTTQGSAFPLYPPTQVCDNKCSVEARGAVLATFACRDRKYALSVPGTDDKRILNFVVSANVKYKHAGACPIAGCKQ